MKIRLLVILLLAITSTQGFAKEFIYEGKVKGMVCAFCVYGVSKSISNIPGVDTQSVNVDLKSGQVNFHSTKSVSFNDVASVFKGSGFKLLSLEKADKDSHKMTRYENKPIEVVTLDSADIDKSDVLIEKLGNRAAKDRLKIVITAPSSVEEKILRPMIGGKQQSIRVQYIFKEKQGVKIELYKPLG